MADCSLRNIGFFHWAYCFCFCCHVQTCSASAANFCVELEFDNFRKEKHNRLSQLCNILDTYMLCFAIPVFARFLILQCIFTLHGQLIYLLEICSRRKIIHVNHMYGKKNPTIFFYILMYSSVKIDHLSDLTLAY